MVRYVAFEGVDGAGKTTVAARVAEAVTEETGVEVVLVREPGGTATGEEIRHVLLAPEGREVAPWTEALLFAAARAQLAAEVVGPALEAGFGVFSDRSVYSSLAYQAGARGLGTEIVRAVNEAGLQGVWPELVVLLRVEPAAALAREDEADRISVEGVDLQAAVARAYDDLAAADEDRFVVVDAAGSIDDVVLVVAEAVVARW